MKSIYAREYPANIHPVNFGILLDQTNRIRQALAIGEGILPELPKGIIGNGQQCVLARALSNGWTTSVDSSEIVFRHKKLKVADFQRCAHALRQLGFIAEYLAPDNDASAYREHIISMRPTKTMSNFILRFDEGDFPELVLEKRRR